MRVLVGLALVALGVLVAVAQVRWAARASAGPPRTWRVSEALSPRSRYLSDVAIAVLLLAGALTVAWAEPWWAEVLAVLGAAAVAATAQALALRQHRRHPVDTGA